MKGFVKDIESIAVKNEDFRRVLYTARVRAEGGTTRADPARGPGGRAGD